MLDRRTADEGVAATDRPKDLAPSRDPISAALDAVRADVGPLAGGDLADYIPELALADPNLFGLALVSMRGRLYETGDARVPFTVQSVSKPFVYALALADLGLDEVLRHVGAEPSGEAFNAISLEPETGRLDNPMVNAGAIATSSIVVAAGPAERFERIRAMLSAFAGRDLAVDEAVYASEQETGDRNRALAHLLRASGSLQGSVDDAVEVYFRQCSLVVTTCDLATMVATLAHGGVNPRTGERIVAERIAGHVLSVMATCGMYDYSGRWLLSVGLPAKSGVSGGLVAARPHQFGVGAYSPLLDERGNSVRGVEAMRALSERFDLHLMHDPGRPASPVYGVATCMTESSIGAEPRRVRVVRLQGDLEFAAAEEALDALEPGGTTTSPGVVVLDLTRVTWMNRIAARILGTRLATLRAEGDAIGVVDPDGRGLLAAVEADHATLEEALAAPGVALALSAQPTARQT